MGLIPHDVLDLVGLVIEGLEFLLGNNVLDLTICKGTRVFSALVAVRVGFTQNEKTNRQLTGPGAAPPLKVQPGL